MQRSPFRGESNTGARQPEQHVARHSLFTAVFISTFQHCGKLTARLYRDIILTLMAVSWLKWPSPRQAT